MKNKKFTIVIVIVLILLAIFLLYKPDIINNGFMQNSNKTVTSEEEFNKEKSIEIKTKYCNIYFPLKWEEVVFIEKIENDDLCSVEFSCKINEDKSKHLFNINFGNEEGILIGYVKYDDAEIPVYITSYELKYSKDWSDDEKLVAQSMQDDINYLMNALKSEIVFTSI